MLSGRRHIGLESELAASAALSDREARLVLDLHEPCIRCRRFSAPPSAWDGTELLSSTMARRPKAWPLPPSCRRSLPPIWQGRSCRRAMSATPSTAFYRKSARLEVNRGPGHAFETMQILQIEHGFNASTFAARVIASTLAPVQNVIAGANRHPARPTPTAAPTKPPWEAADRVGSPAKAARFVDDCIARKERVMGMGPPGVPHVGPPRQARLGAGRRRSPKAVSMKPRLKTLAAIERALQ